MSPDMRAGLLQLLQLWNHQISKRMESARHEANAHGRQAIEHGAVCIYNCAMELRQILSGHQEGQEALKSPGPLALAARPCQVGECSTAQHSCLQELPGLAQYLRAHADRSRALQEMHQLAAKLAEPPLVSVLDQDYRFPRDM